MVLQRVFVFASSEVFLLFVCLHMCVCMDIFVEVLMCMHECVCMRALPIPQKKTKKHTHAQKTPPPKTLFLAKSGTKMSMCISMENQVNWCFIDEEIAVLSLSSLMKYL